MGKESPHLSIIVPIFNDADSLKELMHSISIQTFKNFEVLVIDGLSNDHIREVINKYENLVSCFLSEKDEGIFDAMNKGIKNAKGEWLYFIGADDKVYDENVFENVFSSEEAKTSDIIYAKVWNEHKEKAEGEIVFNQKDFVNKNLWHQSMFFKKSVFEEAGLYEKEYKIAADTVFNIKAFCQHSFNWAYLNLIISSFSGAGISAQKNDVEYHKEQYKIYFSNFDQLNSKEIYQALQHHLYVEIKQGNLFYALKEYILLSFRTGLWLSLTKNSLSHLKSRILN